MHVARLHIDNKIILHVLHKEVSYVPNIVLHSKSNYILHLNFKLPLFSNPNT